MFAVRKIFVIMHYDKDFAKVDNNSKLWSKKEKEMKYFAKIAKVVIDSTLLTRDGISKLLRD
jgi:hypothetical protein